jgi:hypothetical protein
MLLGILDELVGGSLPTSELRRVGLSIIGQCFLYRAAGDVVGMLVPAGEVDACHTPHAIADHITRFSLAALGLGEPLVRSGSISSVLEVPR